MKTTFSCIHGQNADSPACAELPQMTIPSLPGWLLIRNLYDILFNRLDLLQRVSQVGDDIVSIRILSRNIIMLNRAELVDEVLVEHASAFEKGPLVGLIRQLIGDGLFTSKNEPHKQQRKLLQPAFTPRRIASYADTMVHYTEQLQNEWNGDEKVDIVREMMRLTMRIAGKTLFGTDVLKEADELQEALTTAMNMFISKITSPARVVPFTWWPTNKRLDRAVKRLDETLYRMIAERRQSGEDPGDMLSMLLRIKHEDDGSLISDTEVRDEALTLFIAGHETTALALVWTWYLLAQHQDVYIRMQEEVDRVLGGRLPNYGDLDNLPYVEQVFKESLRLYPTAHIISRQATRSIEIGGYNLPAGAHLWISPFVIHRRTDYYPNPNRFNPDNFIAEGKEAKKRRPPSAYIPFGNGQRICIGKHFAMMEGRLILATLAQRVTFDLVPGQHVEPEPLVTLRPKKGIKMIVRRREAK